MTYAPTTVDALRRLLEILSWARPHDSECEKRFNKEFLDTVPGMEQDAFGNRMIRIGDSKILWSCHVDTVAARGGPQEVCVDENGIASLSDCKPGRSLGADDGVGVWLMLEMISQQRPGLYVFHRGEEQGCLGSRWLLQHNEALLRTCDAAVAFDRMGTEDIITHQVNGRTASDEFGQAFADKLNATGMKTALSSGGVYTDTNEYCFVIPECSNIAVGYYANHGPYETLDLAHCANLYEAMMVFDASDLPIVRDPEVAEFVGYSHYRPSRRVENDVADLAALIQDAPSGVASMLLDYGITYQDVQDYIFEAGGNFADRPFEDDEDPLYCDAPRYAMQ